jgi:hypothetical protein
MESQAAGNPDPVERLRKPETGGPRVRRAICPASGLRVFPCQARRQAASHALSKTSEQPGAWCNCKMSILLAAGDFT